MGEQTTSHNDGVSTVEFHCSECGFGINPKVDGERCPICRNDLYGLYE